MKGLPFLDTNILLYHLRREDPSLAAKASTLLSRIEQGELRVWTSDLVIFETVYTLQRVFKASKQQIAASVLPLIELPGIVLPKKQRYQQVFSLYLTTKLGFADSYHVVLMQEQGIDTVFSFDTDFDHIPGISRKEE